MEKEYITYQNLEMLGLESTNTHFLCLMDFLNITS